MLPNFLKLHHPQFTPGRGNDYLCAGLIDNPFKGGDALWVEPIKAVDVRLGVFAIALHGKAPGCNDAIKIKKNVLCHIRHTMRTRQVYMLRIKCSIENRT